MIPARNEIYAQDIYGKWRVSAAYSSSIKSYTLPKILDIFRLSAVVEQSGAPTYSSLIVVPVASRTAPDTPLSPQYHGGHLVVCGP